MASRCGPHKGLPKKAAQENTMPSRGWACVPEGGVTQRVVA